MDAAFQLKIMGGHTPVDPLGGVSRIGVPISVGVGGVPPPPFGPVGVVLSSFLHAKAKKGRTASVMGKRCFTAR